MTDVVEPEIGEPIGPNGPVSGGVDSDSAGSNAGQEGHEQPSRAIQLVALGVGVVVFALIMVLAFGGGAGDDSRSSVLGQRVPRVSGMPIENLAGYSVDADGAVRAYDIDEHRGEWVLVNFFATWCPPCIAEHPELVSLEDWGIENNLTIAAVVFNDPDTTEIQEFFEREGGDWPVFRSAGTAVDFQIAQIPESFLVAPNGQVIEHFIGGIKAADVQATITDLTG